MRHSAWLWLALGGCTYVTQSEYDAQLLQRDEDRDGVTVGEGDCDDSDPEIKPGAIEVPYDGIDNDCGGNGDLVDVDGDGFAAMVVGGDDCDDGDRDVAPGAEDAPYDGIDADCARDNDYDHDGDGVMALVATPALVEAYQDEWDARFVPVYGDCDDSDPSTFPGSLEEVPYDGVDSDCDGADDFDFDGDGFPIDTDCLDQPRAELPIDPTRVHDGAADVPYDGIDADCAGDNDFDADGDGFIRASDLAAYQHFESVYGLSFDARVGDCDDARGFVSPDGLERLGDTLDQNCDGEPDQATFALGGITVVDPGSPRVEATAEGFVFALTAGEVTAPGVAPASDAVLMGLLGPELLADELPIDLDVPIERLGASIGQVVDLAPVPLGVAIGHVWSDGDTTTGSLGVRSVASGSFDALSLVSSATPLSGAPVVADVRSIDGSPRLVSCADDRLVLFETDNPAVGVLAGAATTCFQDPQGLAVGCTTAGCRSFEVGIGPPSLDQPSDDLEPIVAASQREVLRTEILDKVDGGRILKAGEPADYLLSTHKVLEADAVESNGERFIVAVVEPDVGPTELRLLWGSATGSLDSAVIGGFDPARPDLAPVHAAVAAGDSRVVVLVTLTDGSSDAVAWAVYERP